MWFGARLAAVRRMRVLLGVSFRSLALLAGLGVVAAVLEALGIGLLIPVLEYVERGPRMFTESAQVAAVARVLAPFGIAPSLPWLFSAAFAMLIARQLFRFLRQFYAGRVRFAAIARLRQQGMTALLNADLAYVLSRGHARLVGTLTTEVERCAGALPMFLQLIESAVLISMYFLLLIFVAAPLVPIVVIAMLVTAVAIRTKIRHAERLGQIVTAQAGALQVAATERLIGFRLVKLRGREGEESTRLGRLIGDLSSSQAHISAVKEALSAAVEPIMLAGVFVALYVAIAVLGISLVSIGVFCVIVMRLVPLLRQVNDARLGIAALVSGLQEIASQTEGAAMVASPRTGGVPFTGLRQDLVFDRVGFRYDDGDRWALQDVSFRATKGSLTAIVGRSGAGKSTLLDLVPRLRRATSGEIRIDGTPIERFDVGSLRRAIGFVDQQGFLFDRTIAENIAYGAPDAAPEAIADAARRAHAAEFIERLPEGYATRVGPEGHRLSVGQRQRVCIARVLLQDPDVLLLDEPTSALDGESEQYIRAVLDDIRRYKVVIVVAHRLSTIRGADQIIVLDNGRVVEQGKHEALRAQLGTYHQLFDLSVSS